MELEGRVALITGSTSGGIGRSTAFTLASNGADIVLNYGTNRKDAEADEAAEEVKKAILSLGRRALVAKADTAVAKEVEGMVNAAVREFGKVDILVNNAGGVWSPKDITKTEPEQFLKVIDAEICGVYHCIRECLPIMRRNGWGRIVNLGVYEAGHWAAEEFGPAEYAIGKGGRALLTRHLALKERKSNITVNIINPGPGHTPHFESIEEALVYADHSAEWSSRKHSTPQDIADAVLFLCTEAARFITGSHLTFSVE